MDEDAERNILRQVLKERCPPDEKFRDDDINTLVDAGYYTAARLEAASEVVLNAVLPTRPGVVGLLVRTFRQPADASAKEEQLRQLLKEKEQLHAFAKEEQLRQLLKEKEQLQQENLLLLKAATSEGFSHSKRPRNEDGAPRIQSFAESAAKHYRQWEQAEKAGVKNGGQKSFLVVNEDPFGSHPKGFVVWIRKCYRDLKEMLTKAEPSKRFVFLGTAGIGKFVFTLFWICYLATLKQKVVWKFNDAWYLLDFSKEGSSSAKWVSDWDNELQQVLNDRNAWLIIDGKQPGALNYRCHILLACSDKKENYHEFAKNQMVSRWYVPVWSKEEFDEFLDDFEAVRVNYSHMDVPTKVVALENFGKLGGVPRYALCSARIAEGLDRVETAVQSLDRNTCFKYFSGAFEDKTMSDSLIHIKCMDESYGLDSKFYDFASPYVQDEFGKRFTKLSEVDVVLFLQTYANKDAGNIYGYIFELVAHQLMQQGGEFLMKRVGSKGLPIRGPQAEAENTLRLTSGMPVVEFSKVEELVSPNTYYQPRSSNFQSVDAVIHPNILLQFFSSRRGIHGYKVNGLKDLHEQLKQTEYKLCSCVPVDKYESTGFQNWLKADKTKYFLKAPGQTKHQTESATVAMLELMDQYVVQVDYSKYSS